MQKCWPSYQEQFPAIVNKQAAGTIVYIRRVPLRAQQPSCWPRYPAEQSGKPAQFQIKFRTLMVCNGVFCVIFIMFCCNVWYHCDEVCISLWNNVYKYIYIYMYLIRLIPVLRRPRWRQPANRRGSGVSGKFRIEFVKFKLTSHNS